ncbi:DUF6461 domain-containing protein [Nocardia sp. NPDC056100]|uniref:DUF6461 domain-containing protein n=1 Tax=Nocardia sp. NPDC056100 TaxID=3345712 RepID=UPI0035D60B7A
MGWKVNGLIVEGTVDAARLPGRPHETGETVAIDGVYERHCDYGIAVVGGWTFIADPEFLVSFNDEAAQALSVGGRALAWVTNSVASLHGFAWYVDGVAIRRIMYAEGAIADESGEPLPAEALVPEPGDEDYVFEMMARLTGQGWGEGADADYRVWSCSEQRASH